MNANKRRPKKSNKNGPSGRLALRKPRTDTLERNIPLYPPRKKAYLTYYEGQLSITASATANGYVFAANGLYDCNVTGTGHQPMGYDQMMVFYTHYTVVAAKIKCYVHNNSSTYVQTVSLTRNAASTVMTDPLQIIESGNCEYRMLNIHGGFGGIQVLTMDMKIGAFAGVDDVLDDDTYRGLVGSNPADLEYFQLSCWNALDNTSVSVTFDVLIEFEAIFTEPKKPTTSLVSRKREEMKNDDAVLVVRPSENTSGFGRSLPTEKLSRPL